MTQNSASANPTPTTTAAPPQSSEGIPGGHFNKITQKWETPDQRPELLAEQNGQTFPEEIGEVGGKPSFKEQAFGFAKQFHGKTFKNKQEVAQGEALLQGKGVENAAKVAETVKKQQQS